MTPNELNVQRNRNGKISATLTYTRSSVESFFSVTKYHFLDCCRVNSSIVLIIEEGLLE